MLGTMLGGDSKSGRDSSVTGSQIATNGSNTSQKSTSGTTLSALFTTFGDKWDFDNPKWLGRWVETDVDEIWTAYWKEYTAMARSGLFDFLGHPDLIKKFAYTPEGDLRRFYDPVIEAVEDCGVAIELNTAGFHKPCAEQYPSAEFLKLAAEAKIPITLSSDAHAPAEVARDFDKGLELIKAAGFTHLSRFEKRTRSQVLIPR